MGQKKSPLGLRVVGTLVFVAVATDIADFFMFLRFLRQQGIGFWSRVQPQLILDYLTTPPGAILTFLGVAPWLFLLVWAYWQARGSRRQQKVDSRRVSRRSV